MVFDLTNLESFESLEGLRNEFLAALNPKDPHSFPFVILGNKCDEVKQRSVELSKIKQYCESKSNMHYFEISSKVNTNIETAFEEIVKLAFKRYCKENEINDLNKEDNSSFCKEQNHKNKLEFYCKNHNKLCWAACLSKITGNGYGQHFNCEVCLIKEIKEEKKNKLKENVKYLEESTKNMEELLKNLKDIYEKINASKEEKKLKISNIFNQIKNIINKREEQLLLDLDNTYDNIYFKEDLIKKGELIPEQIKTLLEQGNKLINEQWDDKQLCETINYCDNIENNVKIITEINKSIEKFYYNKVDIKFLPENLTNVEIIKNINNFGKIISLPDDEGIEEESIIIVMKEVNCSRQEAIKALKAHNKDPVEALLEFS